MFHIKTSKELSNKGLKEEAKKALIWLKEHGYLDLFKEKLITIGKSVAFNFCSTYLGTEFCTNAVEGLAKLLGL